MLRGLLYFSCTFLALTSFVFSQGTITFEQNLHLYSPPDGKLFLFQSDFFPATQSLTGLDYSYPDKSPRVSVTQADFEFDINLLPASFYMNITAQGITLTSSPLEKALNVTYTYQCTGSSQSLTSKSSFNVTQIKYTVQWSSDQATQAPIMTPTLSSFQLTIIDIGDDVKCKPDTAGFSTYLSQKLQQKVKSMWTTLVPSFTGKNFNNQYKWKIKNTTEDYYDYYTMDLTFSSVSPPFTELFPVSYSYQYSISWSNQQEKLYDNSRDVNQEYEQLNIQKGQFNGVADDCVVIPPDLLWNITSQVFLNKMQTTLTIDSSNAPLSFTTFPVPALEIRQLVLVAPTFDISSFSPSDEVSLSCKFTDFDRTFNSLKYNVSMTCNVIHDTNVLWVSNFDVQGDFSFRVIRQADKCDGKYALQTLMVYPNLIMKAIDKTSQQAVDKNVIQRWQAKIVESFFQKWIQLGNTDSNFMPQCWNYLVELNRDGDNTATVTLDSMGAKICYDVDYSQQTSTTKEV